MNENINRKKEIPKSIIEGLSSLLKKERQDAVDAFLSEGYDLKLLNDYIFTKDTNLFSSFIQISSRGNDDSKINFWTQFEKYCLEFYNGKEDLDFNFNHIINSANKYFINDENIWFFLDHLKDLNQRVIAMRKDIILAAYKIIHEYERSIFSSASLYVEVKYDENIKTLTEEDINIMSEVSSFSFVRELLNYADDYEKSIFNYFDLLKDRFYYGMCYKLNDYNVLNYLSEEENLKGLVGIDNTFVINVKNSAIERINLLDPDEYISSKINEFNLSNDIFERIELCKRIDFFVYSLKYSEADHFQKEVYPVLSEEFYSALEKMDDFEERKELVKDYYFFTKLIVWNHSIFYYLIQCDSEIQFNSVISKMRKIETLFIKEDSRWKELYMDLMLYLIFEQNDVNLSESLELGGIEGKCDLSSEQKTKFRNILKNRIKEMSDYSNFNNASDIERSRYYNCIEVMLDIGDIDAYYIAKDLYELSKTRTLNLTCNNYFEFHLMRFIESKGKGSELTKKSFEIGLEWERICNRIAESKYGKILSEFNNQTRLPNNSIPDIIIDRNIQYKNNRVNKSEIIIECKSSMYFITGIYDIVNNDTTLLYLPYCDQLQYWILQEFEDYNPDLQHERVRFFFAKDFLKDPNISNDIKEDIEKLLDIRSTTPTAFSNLSIEELFEYIDSNIIDKEIG